MVLKEKKVGSVRQRPEASVALSPCSASGQEEMPGLFDIRSQTACSQLWP